MNVATKSHEIPRKVPEWLKKGLKEIQLVEHPTLKNIKASIPPFFFADPGPLITDGGVENPHYFLSYVLVVICLLEALFS